MFFGESFVFPVFLIKKAMNKEKFRLEAEEDLKHGKGWMNPVWVIITSGCDVVSSSMSFVSLMFIPGSVYLMLRGGVIIISAALNKFMYGKEIHRHQIFGCLFVFAGITIVGSSSIFFPLSDGSKEVTVG